MLLFIIFKAVQNETSDKTSKTQTDTQRYSEGWDRIFGQKTTTKEQPN